jgi:DNA-binding transcriptional LysR family regulator
MDNLKKLDMNLLITLDTLFNELNVTNTAKVLHLSQPTISAQLNKLRVSLDDPLFLPSPRGVLPTARAELLKEPLREALKILDKVVSSPEPFIPETSERVWRVVAADYSETNVLLPVLEQLQKDSPKSRLSIEGTDLSDISSATETQRVDLVLHTREEAPDGVRIRSLFTEKYVLVARNGHPKLEKSPSLEEFLALNFLIISPNGGGFIGNTDQILGQMGLKRKVVLSVQHFMFAVSTIEKTDIVAMLPSRLVKNNSNLMVLEAPIEVPGFELNMMWSDRLHRDPAHRWFRNLIIESLSTPD